MYTTSIDAPGTGYMHFDERKEHDYHFTTATTAITVYNNIFIYYDDAFY